MNNKYFFAMMLLLSNAAFAQPKFAGAWEGTLKAGQDLKIVYHIASDDGVIFSCTMDSPDQGAYGIPCSGTKVNGDTLTITLNEPKCSYKGYITDTGKITGKFSQGGMSLPLDLHKVYSVEVMHRPQEPKPPFNYSSEDVTFQNENKTITYGGTLTMPHGKGTFPAVLLITGSGPQNRDEEIMGHKPFAVIADYLTNHGYIVLRVDDRGIGQTTGDRTNATTADYADDAIAELNYLQTRKEVDLKKIGLMGHSEGGMIAPMVAANRKDVDFIVLLAGPGIKITQLMAEQNEAILKSTGVSNEYISKYSDLYRNIEQIIISAKDSNEAKAKINEVINTWKAVNTKDLVYNTTRISDEVSQQEFVKQFTYIYNSAWFRYFLAYDPAINLQKLSCKVLALNGQKDIQVKASSNLAGIMAALKKSKSTKFENRQLPGLNHLFQHCKTCTVQEYGKIEETFAPEALEIITDWLDKNVK